MEHTDTEQPQKEAPLAPIEFLRKVDPRAADRVAEWKKTAPGGRVRVFGLPPDQKRVFVLRGFTANELATVQSRVMGANQNNQRITQEELTKQIQAGIISLCVLYSNVVSEGIRVDAAYLDRVGAGQASALYMVIADLSDYVDPDTLDQYYGDL